MYTSQLRVIAHKVFDEMPLRNNMSWNVPGTLGPFLSTIELILANFHGEVELLGDAVKVFDKTPKPEVHLSVRLLNTRLFPCTDFLKTLIMLWSVSAHELLTPQHPSQLSPHSLKYHVLTNQKFKNVSFSVGQKQMVGTTRRSVLSVQSRKRLEPICALESDIPKVEAVELEKNEKFEQWDSWTAKFSGASNFPFLLLQLPQIILNARNLIAGNPSALLAIPWLGMLTGLLGNMSLLSYFVKKREKEVVVVQTLGVVSIYAVITQLAILLSVLLQLAFRMKGRR